MLFYADENFPRPVVEELRLLGHDVLTALEDRRANQRIPDDDVLKRASELGRIILTINRRDFRLLHKTRVSHAGIVICTQDRDFTGQAGRIQAACLALEEMSGQLIRIHRPSKRA